VHARTARRRRPGMRISHCAHGAALRAWRARLRVAGGSGGEIFENQVSDEVRNREKSRLMWEYTSKLVGLQP